MLSTGWEVRIVKNCDLGLENAARGRRPRAAFSSPRLQFFTIRTDSKPVNNLFTFFLSLKRLCFVCRSRLVLVCQYFQCLRSRPFHQGNKIYSLCHSGLFDSKNKRVLKFKSLYSGTETFFNFCKFTGKNSRKRYCDRGLRNNQIAEFVTVTAWKKNNT